MKESLLTILRDRHTQEREFRKAADKLAELLAAEAALKIEQEASPVETSLSASTGSKVSIPIALVPILRAGMVLLPPFLHFFDKAHVGFFGIRREEVTASPHLYYENLPHINSKHRVFLLDPMLATGGSALLALEKLVQKGAKPSHISLITLIAAPEGIAAVQSHFPEVTIESVAIDKKLNPAKFIVPGLGDFGDRYFGT